MSRSTRVPLIIGNPKMNLTLERARAFLDRFLPTYQPPGDRELAFAIPFTALGPVGEAIRGRSIGLAAQDIFWEDEGPYTGEISGRMLSELGVTYVLVGHSERRTHLGEDDRVVNRKLRAALRNGLTPVLCVGETEDLRVSGRDEMTVRNQVARALDDLTPDSVKGMVAAYEPLWAIGTGRPASPADAARMHGVIRAELNLRLGETAATVRILYGGSVVPGNIDALMAEPSIDGVLVGGASLEPDEFLRIVRYTASLPANR